MSENQGSLLTLAIRQSSRKNVKISKSLLRVIAEHDPREEAHHKGPMLLCKKEEEKLFTTNCSSNVLFIHATSLAFFALLGRRPNTEALRAAIATLSAKEKLPRERGRGSQSVQP